MRCAGAPLGALLDVGTGTGRIAELLEPRAERVTALDKSPEMLRIARARLQELPPGRVELVQGDFAALPFARRRLRYAWCSTRCCTTRQEPETALAEAARVTPRGRADRDRRFRRARSRGTAQRATPTPGSGFADAQMLRCSARPASPPSRPRWSARAAS